MGFNFNKKNTPVLVTVLSLSLLIFIVSLNSGNVSQQTQKADVFGLFGNNEEGTGGSSGGGIVSTPTAVIIEDIKSSRPTEAIDVEIAFASLVSILEIEVEEDSVEENLNESDSDTASENDTEEVSDENESLIEVEEITDEEIGEILEEKIAAKEDFESEEEYIYSIFTKDLWFGYRDLDVLELQKFLNSYGFIVSTEGAGSPGNETLLFGVKTKNAVTKFQEVYKESILEPFGLTKGTGYFGEHTRKKIEEIIN
jgi:hypothetical protein